MKKRVAKVFAAVMCLVMCLGTTVFASGNVLSPGVADTVIKGVSGGYDIYGNPLGSGDLKLVVQTIQNSAMPEEYQAAVDELKTEAGLAKALTEAGVSKDVNWTIASVIDVDLLGVGNLAGKTKEELKALVQWPITLRFDMDGVVPTTKIQILHWTGSAWEKIPTTPGQGWVEGTFNSLSPVAFLVDKATLANGGKTSPKTSASATATIALIGLCAVAAAVGMKRRNLA